MTSKSEKSSARAVAVTGCSGYVGRRLVAALCEDDRVERVLGFDVAPAGYAHPKFVFDEIDVRSPALEARFGGLDAVVHLAFIMDPIRDEDAMRDVNVNGSQNVFRAAARAGVGRIVYMSSAVAYGAHPDNDLPLTEESPLRANLDFSYAAHKLEVEYVVQEIKAEWPEVVFTVFRPAIVFGPHVDNAWSHALEAPVLVGIRGWSPPLQFVHEDDVARALAWSLFERLDGAYNLAAPGWLEASEILQIIGRRRFDLPEPVAFGAMEKLWRAGLAETPAGLLHYVMHPWVLATDKLAAAGFTCSRSNREALEATIAGLGRHVRLGRARVPKASLWAAGAGLLGIGAAVVAARRRAG